MLYNHPYVRRQCNVDLPCSAKLIPYRPSFVPLRSHPTLETLITVVSLPSHELICRCSRLYPDAWATRYYRGSDLCPSSGPLPLLRSASAIGSAPSPFIQTLYGYAGTVVWGTGALGSLLNSHLLTIALPPQPWINSMAAFYSSLSYA